MLFVRTEFAKHIPLFKINSMYKFIVCHFHSIPLKHLAQKNMSIEKYAKHITVQKTWHINKIHSILFRFLPFMTLSASIDLNSIQTQNFLIIEKINRWEFVETHICIYTCIFMHWSGIWKFCTESWNRSPIFILTYKCTSRFIGFMGDNWRFIGLIKIQDIFHPEIKS